MHQNNKTIVRHVNSVNLSDDNVIYIGRRRQGIDSDGFWGNHIHKKSRSLSGTTLAEYEQWFLHCIEYDDEFRKRVETLRGKTLACWCHPKPCHGDVIANWLNSTT